MEYIIGKANKLSKLKKKISSITEKIYIQLFLFGTTKLHIKFCETHLTKYLERKNRKLQQEIIKARWDKVTLDNAVKSIQEISK